jgi:DnaJ family protein A protein 5
LLTPPRIKKAYRRKALELHPDRNFGHVDRTTALFAEVQSAYEVLSDPQERSWYDAHEGDILRGGAGEGGGEDHYEGDMRVTTADDIARMLGKFRGNVEFSDAPNGFFGYLRDIFAQLAKEEEYAADWQDVDIPIYPTFGHKADNYEDVVRDFYAVWNGFATRKSFAWMDVYRLSEAPDRRVRRLMEKENKRHREEGIREFNQAVRTLLAFVKKRDPRVPRYNPNAQTPDEEAKAQRVKAKKQADRARAAREAEMAQTVPDWAVKRDFSDEEGEEEEAEIEENHYECVACNKTFKSERQYEAHEKSKKHQKAIQSLKRKMQKDNAHLNLDEDVTGSDGMTPMDGVSDFSEDAEDGHGLETSVNELAEGVDDLGLQGTTESTGKENARDTEDVRETSDVTEEHNDTQPKPTTPPDPASSSDDEYTSRSDIEARLASFRHSSSTSNLNPDTSTTSKSAPPTSDPTRSESTTSNSVPPPSEPKLGAAAVKRAKKAAKQAELDQSDLKHKCTTCNAAFSSKTQLFQHVRDFDHAAPVSVTKNEAGAGKKKGRRK